MLINKKNRIVCLWLFCVASCLFGANSNNNDSKDVEPWTYKPLAFNAVETELHGLYKLLTQGDSNGKPIHSLLVRGRSQQVLIWAKRPWIEVETEVQRAWYKKVIAQINYMGQLKKQLELAKYNKQLDLPENKKLIYKYKAAIEYFKKLIDKPDKVDRKNLIYLKRKRKEWLKLMAKKDKERLERLRSERRRNGGR